MVKWLKCHQVFYYTNIIQTNYTVTLSTTRKVRVRKVCNTRLVLTSSWTAARSELCCLYHYLSKSSQASSTVSPAPSYHSGLKILLLAIKALNLAPLYLSELLHMHTPLHSQNLFCHPDPTASALLTTTGFQAFSHSAQRLWNSLSHNIFWLN